MIFSLLLTNFQLLPFLVPILSSVFVPPPPLCGSDVVTVRSGPSRHVPSDPGVCRPARFRTSPQHFRRGQTSLGSTEADPAPPMGGAWSRGEGVLLLGGKTSQVKAKPRRRDADTRILGGLSDISARRGSVEGASCPPSPGSARDVGCFETGPSGCLSRRAVRGRSGPNKSICEIRQV